MANACMVELCISLLFCDKKEISYEIYIKDTNCFLLLYVSNFQNYLTTNDTKIYI